MDLTDHSNKAWTFRTGTRVAILISSIILCRGACNKNVHKRNLIGGVVIWTEWNWRYLLLVDTWHYETSVRNGSRDWRDWVQVDQSINVINDNKNNRNDLWPNLFLRRFLARVTFTNKFLFFSFFVWNFWKICLTFGPLHTNWNQREKRMKRKAQSVMNYCCCFG